LFVSWKNWINHTFNDGRPQSSSCYKEKIKFPNNSNNKWTPYKFGTINSSKSSLTEKLKYFKEYKDNQDDNQTISLWSKSKNSHFKLRFKFPP